MQKTVKIAETFWLRSGDQKGYSQVTKKQYVDAERGAGFLNKVGQPNEPATESFSGIRNSERVSGEATCRWNITLN